MRVSSNLVNLLDIGVLLILLARRSTARRTARHATRHATLTTSSVELHHDGVGNALELLLLLLVLLTSSLLVLIKPLDNLVNLGLEGVLVAGLNLLLDLGVAQSVAERVSVGLKAVLGADTGTLLLILLLVLLSISKHALNFLLGQAALVVGNDNLVGLASTLLDSRDVDDTIGIDIEGDLNLRDTARSRRDTGQLELAEQVVVLGALALTLVDLDEHTRLVVREGGEDLRLLGGDSGVAGDELGHHTTGSFNAERQGGDIEQQNLVGRLGGGVTRQDGGLDGSTVGDSLVGVDGLVGLLAVEVVADELLDAGDTGGATNENNLVDLALVDLGVTENAVEGLGGGAEEVLAELLETGPGDGGVEVNTLEERVDLNRGLGRGREGTLGTLASSAETAQSTGVGGQILYIKVSN